MEEEACPAFLPLRKAGSAEYLRQGIRGDSAELSVYV
jgi:hypothetical protein